MLVLAATLGAAGCVGILGDDGGSTSGSTPTPTPTPTPPVESSEHGIRLPRLSHLQWARTAQAFLRLTDTPLFDMRKDTIPEDGFETDDRARVVDKSLTIDYRSAAESLSNQEVDVDEAFVKFTADAGSGDVPTRLRAIITSAWPRAYRRPLTKDEIDRYVALGMAEPDYKAAEGKDENAQLRAALRLLIRVTLQSPYFVYRVELGDPAGEVQQGKYQIRPLTPGEYATRLAYTLFDAPPDDALIAAVAAAGASYDPSQLVDDPRATDTLLRFNAALYVVDAARSMIKDTTKFPEAQGIGPDAAHEAELFLDDVVKKGGGLREILLSRGAFVNQRLAPIYGLPTDGLTTDQFSPFDLPAERAGILTRVSWTGTQANLFERNTILRGVYVARKVLCVTLQNPPIGAAESAPKPPAQLVSNREKVTFRTAGSSCAGCHQGIINPNGFAFEGFDAIGRFLVDENGMKVDSTGTANLDGKSVSFTGARDFLEQAAEADQTHGCYVGNLDSWVLGRPLADFERDDAAPTAKHSRADHTSIRALLAALIAAPAFRSVVQEAQ
jgi:hypothetical protein